MGIYQWQARGFDTLLHGLLTLLAFAFVKRRSIHHNQQLRTMVLGVLGGLFKPSVLTNQQAHLNALNLKNCAVFAGDKIPALIKHLVVG